MFAYCRNNPVTYTDPTGNSPLLAVVPIVVGAAVSGISTWQAGGTPEQIAVSAISGALIGTGEIHLIALGGAFGTYNTIEMTYQQTNSPSKAALAGVISLASSRIEFDSLFNYSSQINNSGSSFNTIKGAASTANNYIVSLITGLISKPSTSSTSSSNQVTAYQNHYMDFHIAPFTINVKPISINISITPLNFDFSSIYNLHLNELFG